MSAIKNIVIDTTENTMTRIKQEISILLENNNYNCNVANLSNNEILETGNAYGLDSDILDIALEETANVWHTMTNKQYNSTDRFIHDWACDIVTENSEEIYNIILDYLYNLRLDLNI